MTTAQAQAKQRQQLARYSREELEGETVLTLREMAKGLFPISRLPKKKLIENILIATQAERELLVLTTEQSEDSQKATATIAKEAGQNIREDLSGWLPHFYEDFRRITIKDSDQGKLSPKLYANLSSLAKRITDFAQRPSRWGRSRSPLTIIRDRTTIMGKLKEMLDTEADNPHHSLLSASFDELKQQVSIQFADISFEKKGRQERQLAERKEERNQNVDLSGIDFKPIFDFASATLKELNELLPRDWRQVVVSLVVVTGRRPAEIQNSSTILEVPTQEEIEAFKERLPMLTVNAPVSNLCWFTGQLKEKGLAGEFYNLEPRYLIPTLVDSELVVSGLQWLKDNKKTVDNPEAANRRYSKDLSAYYKSLRSNWEIKNDLVTNKGLRAIYAQVCNHLYNGSNPDNVLFLAKILGHGRADLMARDGDGYKIKSSARLTDMVTPQSYNSDFVVQNWAFLR